MKKSMNFTTCIVVLFLFVGFCSCSNDEPRINRVELGVPVNLYSDTTLFCGPTKSHCYTAVRGDISEVNSTTPCCWCGELYDKHLTSLELAVKQASANYN